MNKTSEFPSAIGRPFAINGIVILIIIRMEILSGKRWEVPRRNHVRMTGKNKGFKEGGRENDTGVLLQRLWDRLWRKRALGRSTYNSWSMPGTSENLSKRVKGGRRKAERRRMAWESS